MPAVSVIMPAYNVARYIGASIDSIFAQTFADWELVIVDDGSTDETAAIAAVHARRDARVRLERKANGGISTARNVAMRLARGELFAILDSDDLWEPTYLETQVGLLRARPDIDVVTGNAWNLGGRRSGRPVRPWPDPREAPALSTILGDEEAVFIMSVFRRRVYEAIGGFDEALRTNEDYDYWIRAAAAGFRFLRNDRPLGRYRRRDDSLSAKQATMLRGILRVYEKSRPIVAGRPAAQAILEAQVARFQTELLAAEARDALARGDADRARHRLSALYRRQGGARLRLASMLARWAPGLLTRAYHWRRAYQQAAP